MARGARYRGLGDRAILERLGDGLGLNLGAQIQIACRRSGRLLGDAASINIAHVLAVRIWRWRQRSRLGAKECGFLIAGAIRPVDHLHIEPGIHELRRVRRTPVRDHDPLEAQLLAQNRGQRGAVAARIGPVHMIIGAHHCRNAGLNRRLERRQIDFVQRLLVHPYIARRGVVGDEVLGHGHDMLRLDTPYHCRADPRRQQRVLPKRVIGAPERKIAVDVDIRLQRDIDAERASFAPDDHSVLLRELHVKGGSHTHGRSLGLRRLAGEHPGRSIGEPQARNPQARHASYVPRLALIAGWVFAAVVNQRQLLGQRHLAEQPVDLRVAGNRRHAALPQCHWHADSQQRDSQDSPSHLARICRSLERTEHPPPF